MQCRCTSNHQGTNTKSVSQNDIQSDDGGEASGEQTENSHSLTQFLMRT